MTPSDAAQETTGVPLPPSATSEREQLTGERDESYDLISVIYHALQGAKSCAQYVRDAHAHADEQLAQFFEEVRGSHVEVAQQAKQLLAARLDPTDIDDDPLSAG